MFAHAVRIALVGGLIGVCVLCADDGNTQELLPRPVSPPLLDPGVVPNGVEVQARGPVHEAFAAPTTQPKAPPLLPKKPPLPIEEMPPDEKPEGEVVWIGGYWSWDDDRADYLWVSGCWRLKPESKEWVPGYWREVGTNWQWVQGFWAHIQDQKVQPVTYYPEPPPPPNVAPVADAPGEDMIHVPGYWVWNGSRYVWRAGHWTRIRPGHVYVQSHYRWTPFGHVFVAGYWDADISRRGVLYAPVVINTAIVGPRYVYTPYYAVRDTIVLDSLFIRPAFGAYYFGDYYGARYATIGFESSHVYSRRHYEPIIAYERWVYRDNPRWHDARVTLVIERNAGRAPVPPRTLVQQNTIIRNNVTNVTNITNVTNVIAPTKTVVAARGQNVVPLDSNTRARVRESSQVDQQALSADRRKSEATPPGGASFTKPRTTKLNVPTTASAPVAPGPRGSFDKGNPNKSPTGSPTPFKPAFTPSDRPKSVFTPKYKGPPPAPTQPTVGPRPMRDGPKVAPMTKKVRGFEQK